MWIIAKIKTSFTKKKFLLSAMQFMFWAAFGISPFIVVLLREENLSSVTTGLILAVNAFVGIIGQPVWGMASDWIKSSKKIFIFCMSACTVTYIFLTFTRSPLYMGIILAVDTLFRSACAPLLDVWTLSGCAGDENISYGSLRLWGSIGFALTVLLFGIISEGRSVRAIFPFYFVLAAITIILSLFVGYENTSSLRRISLKELKPGQLFSNYHYVTFIIFIFFLAMPNAPAGSFLPDLVADVGGDMGQYGLMHSIKAFLEVPFFFFGKKILEKFGSIRIVIAGACIYAIQMLLFATSATPAQVISAQLLLGPAYSLLLVGNLEYVYKIVPDNLKATAQTFVNAFGYGLSSIVGNYGGGFLIAYAGLRSVYWIGLATDLAVIILFILSFPLYRHFKAAGKKLLIAGGSNN